MAPKPIKPRKQKSPAFPFTIPENGRPVSIGAFQRWLAYWDPLKESEKRSLRKRYPVQISIYEEAAQEYAKGLPRIRAIFEEKVEEISRLIVDVAGPVFAALDLLRLIEARNIERVNKTIAGCPPTEIVLFHLVRLSKMAEEERAEAIEFERRSKVVNKMVAARKVLTDEQKKKIISDAASKKQNNPHLSAQNIACILANENSVSTSTIKRVLAKGAA